MAKEVYFSVTTAETFRCRSCSALACQLYLFSGAHYEATQAGDFQFSPLPLDVS
jgi:hypothetical protein